MALEARDDVLLVRQRIPEPGRYYDDFDGERLIVMRRGLLLSEERRYLWHELVHSDRRDQACHSNHGVEEAVEREAVLRAMPRATLEWAMPQVEDWSGMAELLKLPESWVRYRWRTMLRSDREHLFAVNHRRAADL